MTTQHTPGRPLEAFRRRLEACWHACEGYSTEELEHIAATPQRMRASLTAQRDELLAALKELDKKPEHTSSWLRARAAIAKAEGGAA